MSKPTKLVMCFQTCTCPCHQGTLGVFAGPCLLHRNTYEGSNSAGEARTCVEKDPPSQPEARKSGLSLHQQWEDLKGLMGLRSVLLQREGVVSGYLRRGLLQGLVSLR